MPIYKVIYKNVHGEKETLIDEAESVNELCSKHTNMVEVCEIAENNYLEYAHDQLIALFHNILNIASIGIKLTDKVGGFSEEDIAELITLIEVLEGYTNKARDYLDVMSATMLSKALEERNA